MLDNNDLKKKKFGTVRRVDAVAERSGQHSDEQTHLRWSRLRRTQLASTTSTPAKSRARELRSLSTGWGRYFENTFESEIKTESRRDANRLRSSPSVGRPSAPSPSTGSSSARRTPAVVEHLAAFHFDKTPRLRCRTASRLALRSVIAARHPQRRVCPAAKFNFFFCPPPPPSPWRGSTEGLITA